MANDLIVRILGDTKGLERSFARANQSSAQFGRQMETTGAKIDKTTKKFGAFTRGAAAGFGGAFALTAGIQQVKQLAEVAAESEQVLGQTQVALESTGKSWEKYSGIIEDTIQAQSRLGFDDEELLKTFSLFVRNTDDVGEALRRNNLAMDVARARFIDLEAAAQIVNKAALGNAGALRRLGIDAQKGASGLQLLTLLQEKYGGSAEAASDDAATSFDRTQVAMENLQESLGRLLLPALGKLAENLQQVATLLTNVADGLAKIGAVKVPVIELPFDVTIGGQSVQGIGAGLVGKLKWFGPALPITIANEIAKQFRGATEQATPNLAKSINDAMTKMMEDAIAAAGTFGITPLQGGRALADQFAAGIAGAIAFAQAEAARVIAEGQERIRRQSGLDNAELGLIVAQGTVNNLQDDLAALRAIESSLQKQINAGQDVVANQKRLAEIQNQIAATQRQIAENRKAQDRAARESARAQTQARQFRALGLAASGEEIIPGIKNLQQRINGALRRINSGELDVSSKLVERLKLARALIKKEGKNLTDETRQVINDLIKTVTQGTKALEDKGGPLTKATGLNVQKTLEGLGLTPEVERELRARLSGANSAGRQLTNNNRPTGSFRTGGPVTETTVNVNLDGEQVARSTTRQQQKNKRRNPVQKRGPRSGV